MEQDLMKNRVRVAVIGGGAAGSAFACFYKGDVTVFEKNKVLTTLLYTGGGRCNLAHAEYDFKELTKNYPRGEKFLYSAFSRFSTKDTVKFFKSIGVETYTQSDNRIFPISNEAKTVRDAMLKKMKINGTKFISEEVYKIEKKENKFFINNRYEFDKVVISIGGHSGFDLAKSLGHTVIDSKPSLVGLITKEFFPFKGVSLSNIELKIEGIKKPLFGDIVFTNNGISGPLAYKVSSLFARKEYSKINPIKLYINFHPDDLLETINANGKKDVCNIITKYVPKSIASYICNCLNINNLKGHEISKVLRLKINSMLNEFEITVTGHEKHGEVVTSGGVSLKEVCPKTMQSKISDGLYFCGEVLDIDGFCGGFNLQNAWTTAFIAADNIKLCYN